MLELRGRDTCEGIAPLIPEVRQASSQLDSFAHSPVGSDITEEGMPIALTYTLPHSMLEESREAKALAECTSQLQLLLQTETRMGLHAQAVIPEATEPYRVARQESSDPTPAQSEHREEIITTHSVYALCQCSEVPVMRVP